MNSPLQLTDATLTVDQGVCVLTLNRDDVRNALTGTDLVEDILAATEWINRNPQIGALILTGNGKAFSSGGNVKDMHGRKGMFAEDPTTMQDSYRRGIQRMTLAMYRLEVPAIAAVNGAAIGAGMDLACMCDIRLGSEHAKLGETFVNLGIISGDGGAWLLPRLIGMQRAADLIFSGRIVAAKEAEAIGLLMEVHPAEQLLPRAMELAQQFAAKPREALRMNKRLLQSGQRLELGDFLDYCASQQSLCHTSEQHHQALANFFADRGSNP